MKEEIMEMHGFTIKKVEGKKGCYNCHLKHLDRDLTRAQSLQMKALCNAMPMYCKDEEIDYKIVWCDHV